MGEDATERRRHIAMGHRPEVPHGRAVGGRPSRSSSLTVDRAEDLSGPEGASVRPATVARHLDNPERLFAGPIATVEAMDGQGREREALREHATDPGLAVLRLETATTGASKLREVGRALHLVGHVFGDGRVSGSSPRGNGNDAQVGVGVLAQIGADLLEASASLLSGANHYAGAALLRQIVEVEYLSWAFANEKREAADWLNSTHKDRLDFFTPARLRDISDGRFSASDYRHHCEQGGHPVPRAIPLLGNPDPAIAQMLLVDLLLHSWRTTDNLITWELRSAVHESVSGALTSAQGRFSDWGRSDPLYEWSVSAPPPPP